MSGEINLSRLIRSMKPVLNEGEYVFCSFSEINSTILDKAICVFREPEGISVIFPKNIADENNYTYSYIASWITLMVNSSLASVGLTAAVSNALASENISCNVVAGFYHDHIFVARKDGDKAMRVLEDVSRRQ